MLSGSHLTESILSTYPKAHRDRLRADLLKLLQRDRRYHLGQVQLLFSECNGCARLIELRAKIDHIFLESDDSELAANSEPEAPNPNP